MIIGNNEADELELYRRLPEKGVSEREIRVLVESALDSNRWQNNHLNTGRVFPIPDSFSLDIRNRVEERANVSILSPHIANSFYHVERALGEALANLFGSETPECAGYVTMPSGTFSLFQASDIARERYFRYHGHDMTVEGSYEINKHPRPVILAPIIANGCIRKIARMLGIGERNIEFYNLNQDFTPDIEDIEQRVDRIQKENGQVFLNFISGGDTEHGIIHDASAITEAINRKQNDYRPYNLVDSAGHWYFTYADEFREMCTFANPAVDAIVLDFHKWLAPYDHSMVLFRKNSDLEYTLLEGDREIYLEKHSCSRTEFLRSRAPDRYSKGGSGIFAAYAALLKEGREGLDRSRIRMQGLARKLADYIMNSDNFELISKPMTNIISFTRREGNNREFMRRFNTRFRTPIAYSSSIQARREEDFRRSDIDGFWVLMMPYATEETVENYINSLEEIARL